MRKLKLVLLSGVLVAMAINLAGCGGGGSTGSNNGGSATPNYVTTTINATFNIPLACQSHGMTAYNSSNGVVLSLSNGLSLQQESYTPGFGATMQISLNNTSSVQNQTTTISATSSPFSIYSTSTSVSTFTCGGSGTVYKYDSATNVTFTYNGQVENITVNPEVVFSPAAFVAKPKQHTPKLMLAIKTGVVTVVNGNIYNHKTPTSAEVKPLGGKLLLSKQAMLSKVDHKNLVVAGIASLNAEDNALLVYANVKSSSEKQNNLYVLQATSNNGSKTLNDIEVVAKFANTKALITTSSIADGNYTLLANGYVLSTRLTKNKLYFAKIALPAGMSFAYKAVTKQSLVLVGNALFYANANSVYDLNTTVKAPEWKHLGYQYPLINTGIAAVSADKLIYVHSSQEHVFGAQPTAWQLQVISNAPSLKKGNVVLAYVKQNKLLVLNKLGQIATVDTGYKVVHAVVVKQGIFVQNSKHSLQFVPFSA